MVVWNSRSLRDDNQKDNGKSKGNRRSRFLRDDNRSSENKGVL